MKVLCQQDITAMVPGRLQEMATPRNTQPILKYATYTTLDSTSSASALWHRQVEQLYMRVPFKYCRNGRPMMGAGPL